MTRLHIHQDWAEALNAANGTSSKTVMEAYIDSGMDLYNAAMSASDFSPWNTMTVLLGRAVVVGLARIGSEYTINHNNMSEGSPD